MKIIVVNNYEQVSKKAANILVSNIILNSNCTLGLATGDTPIGMYNEIINYYNKLDLDFSSVKTFNLDEYYGLDKNDPQSYYYYMMNHLFNHININLDNVHILNGQTDNIEKECTNYENLINDCGGIDIQVLGIGVNGHIGFNEPSDFFEPHTNLVHLNDKTIDSNSRFFKSRDDVPTRALSMGIKTIMNSKKIVLIANGLSKADAIYKTVKGKITSKVPASILQLHKDVTLILDRDAASKL